MSQLRKAAEAARAEAEAAGELEPEEVIVGAAVAYIPRSALRSLLAGKLTSAKVYPGPTPGDYALIAVPQERVEGDAAAGDPGRVADRRSNQGRRRPQH